MKQPFLCVVTVLITAVISYGAAELHLGNWMKWSRWSTCTETEFCLQGARERSRSCQPGKTCLGIEAESEMCPTISCKDQPMRPDRAYAEMHSFIAEECVTTQKFLVKSKFVRLMKHNITQMLPRAKTMLQNSYFNVRVTPKTLASEENIYKYCFEPGIKTMTLDDFKSMITTGTLHFSYVSLQCSPAQPTEAKYVTGFAMGFYSSGRAYGIYIQMTDKNGFKTVYYKHMGGSYSDVYNLIWS